MTTQKAVNGHSTPELAADELVNYFGASPAQEGARTAKAFDASRYLTQLKGKDYLEVKWRLLWLRTEHPDAIITTDIAAHEDGFALFKAMVQIPGGGSATGWGSETVTDFQDYLEKAETKALGRALAALGYGTQFCEDFVFAAENADQVVDSPVSFPSRGNVSRDFVPATAPQVKAIYLIGKNERGLSEEEIREQSERAYGVAPDQLSKRQASQFIDALKQTG
jgi:hypothetical protein